MLILVDCYKQLLSYSLDLLEIFFELVIALPFTNAIYKHKNEQARRIGSFSILPASTFETRFIRICFSEVENALWKYYLCVNVNVGK